MTDPTPGLAALATAVVVLDGQGMVFYLNSAAEQLFDWSAKPSSGQRFSQLFVNGAVFEDLLETALSDPHAQRRQEMLLERVGRGPLEVRCISTALQHETARLLLEFVATDQQGKLEREERLIEQANANRELVRNLAHEIKNPLGGIRGAAQLLEAELEQPGLREYTQVIIKEAGRLQDLVDRLLAPHRKAVQRELLNIHEVCERVRSVCLAQYPKSVRFIRDYDASIPEFLGDREQLIQVVLNLVQNAIQAMDGSGEVRLKTRVTRQAILARTHHKLALELHVIDNGPGIPEEIRSRIFFPLVSGRAGGSGLGLSLAQSFVQQHGGLIEFDSVPGRTAFKVILPLVYQ